MSEAERGSTGEDSGRITPTPYNRRSSIERSSSTSGDWTSPIHGRRLPFTGGAEGRRPWWFWPALLATFVLSAIAWRPVLRPLVYGRRPHGGLEHAERVERDGASPHVHVFHEPRCAGESVTLKGAADLCGRHYPSGEPLKDNVASVLLSGAAVMLDVYGTCKLSEKPANPMLLESVGQQGCTELTAPIAGHVEIRPVDRVEL